MWTKGLSTTRKDSANNKSNYSEKGLPNLDSRSRRFRLERVFGESFWGSAQQSVEVCILRGFLESDELGLGGSQALRLQQQISEIAVAPTTAQKRFDVSIDGFHYAH